MRLPAPISPLAAGLVVSCLIATSLLVSSVSAQVLTISDPAGRTDLHAAVGDTLTIVVRADLEAMPASGIAFYLSVPARGLSLLPVDERAGAGPVFQAGDLFSGGMEFLNAALPADQSWGHSDDAVLLGYAIVMGPGAAAARERSGTGVVATLQAICTAPIEGAHIAIFDNAIHQTRVVLTDGRTELSVVASKSVLLSTTSVAARSTTGSWGRLKQLSRRP